MNEHWEHGQYNVGKVGYGISQLKRPIYFSKRYKKPPPTPAPRVAVPRTLYPEKTKDWTVLAPLIIWKLFVILLWLAFATVFVGVPMAIIWILAAA